MSSSTFSDEEALLLLALVEDEGRTRKRRKWVHEINIKREMYGEYHKLVPELRQDIKRFYIYFRMTPDCFDEILNFIANDIRKKYTNYREPISPEERLAVCLRFLATGDSYYTIGHSFRIGFSTVGQIVREVCEAICKRMQEIFMPEPSEEIWTQSAELYDQLWGFPNCIGSIDGKHVTIKCPKNSGSMYYCYLKKFSIVLLAIVGADYKFLCLDIGGYGKNSDSGIFEASNMGRRFQNDRMNMPKDRNLPDQNELCPYVLIGDEGFGLKTYLMRPFPYRQSKHDSRKEIYNTRLCKARRTVENAFGILAQKWRIFNRPIEVSVEKTVSIVHTACILHNYLRTKKFDEEYGKYLEPTERILEAFQNIPLDPRRSSKTAFEVREKFVNYFNA